MRLTLSLALVVFLFSCKSNNEPDVSSINIHLTTYRFERDLYALDTNKLSSNLDQLIAKYPAFGENFLGTILNTDPSWSADSSAAYIRGFISAYRNVYDSSQKVFADFSPYENDIKKGLQYLHYYFPAYKAPQKIITYIGPLDGFGDILTDDAFVIGLHHHLGKSFSMYSLPWVQEVYAGYISNRFEPGTIAINSMKNIVLDMYPEKNEDASLAIQIVEKGKRLYLLSKLLPKEPEYKLIGYTEKQLKDCYTSEAIVWDMFVQNNLLQTIDYNAIKNYVSEGPKTQELGDDSPGNIGSFSGWQIVKKYVSKHPDITPEKLMKLPAETIFSEAKYKP